MTWRVAKPLYRFTTNHRIIVSTSREAGNDRPPCSACYSKRNSWRSVGRWRVQKTRAPHAPRRHPFPRPNYYRRVGHSYIICEGHEDRNRDANALGGAQSRVATRAGARAQRVVSPTRLSVRWLPLVKWLLAISHYVVLAFLWVATVVVVIVAWFAIVFTGRYPRGMFDFVEGVIRWHNRVIAYAFLLVTDVYPPFRLAP